MVSAWTQSAAGVCWDEAQVDAAQNGSAPGLSCGFQEIREDVLLDAEQLLEDHQCGIIGLKQRGGHKPERGSNQIGVSASPFYVRVGVHSHISEGLQGTPALT